MRLLSAAVVMLGRISVAAAVAVILLASTTLAFDPDDLKKLKETNKCVECDLSESDLSDLSLIDANLRRANLEGADLARAEIGRASCRERV